MHRILSSPPDVFGLRFEKFLTWIMNEILLKSKKRLMAAINDKMIMID